MEKSDKFYYNTVKKEDAWREISEIFEEEIAVLKKKMESLRGSRRREKTRMLQSKGTGKGQKDVYISKWFAWESLNFLDDPEEIRQTISNLQEEESGEESSINSGANENIQPIEVTENIQQDDKVSKNIDEVNKPSGLKEKQFLSPKGLGPKRKRSEDTRINEAFNILQSTVTQTNKKKDECSLFGEYIAEKLRKHGNKTRMMLQHQIHNLLFEAEMNRQPTSAQYQVHSQLLPKQPPLKTSKDRQMNLLQEASTSSRYSSPQLDSSSTSYSYSSSPTLSCTPSPLQSPQDNDDITQTEDLLPMQPPLQASSQYSSTRLDSASIIYSYSPSPTLSCTPSPLQSPQDNQDNTQTEDPESFLSVQKYFSACIDYANY